MPGRCFVASFRPLVGTEQGHAAVERFRLPPFVDGSCRREPDFESRLPSITATCRAGNFAPRLQAGDGVAYLTAKGKYLGDSVRCRRLVAVLRVILPPFSTHAKAAAWYRHQGCSVPSNCLVANNPPKTFALTNGKPPDEVKRRLGARFSPRRAIRLWDTTYKQRVRKWPVFLATEAEFLELVHPPRLSDADIVEVFGKVPGTLNPPQVCPSQLDDLIELAGISTAPEEKLLGTGQRWQSKGSPRR